MSAPAALAISKLSYPETEKLAESSKDFSRMEKAKEQNLLEAASAGASASIKLVGAIAVNVIAFLALLGFLNATFTWFGDTVGIENLTFELICSYVLYPVAFFMGADIEDCRKLAELIGVKTFTNEFITYGLLRDLIDNRKALNAYTSVYNSTTQSWHWSGNDILLTNTNTTLIGGVISEKTTILATYALCGFSNFGSVEITLGGMGADKTSRPGKLGRQSNDCWQCCMLSYGLHSWFVVQRLLSWIKDCDRVCSSRSKCPTCESRMKYIWKSLLIRDPTVQLLNM